MKEFSSNYYLATWRLCVMLIGFVLLTVTARSQWEPAEILLNRPGGKHPSAIAANGDTVHVAWQDYQKGNWDIRYMRSLDGGETWEEEVELTDDAASSQSARIAVSGNSVHITFSDQATGTTHVSYFRSTDAGASWSEKIPISLSEAYGGYGRVASDGNDVHVVWMDGRNGLDYDIYHRYSTDGGFTWSEEKNLTSAESADTMLAPTIQVSAGRVHVLYSNWLGNSVQNWYINSLNEGETWSTPVLVDEDPFEARQSVYFSYYPALGVSGDQVYVLATRGWEDRWAGYLKKSLDGGLTWDEMTQVTGHADTTSDPSVPMLAVSDSIVHIAWFDYRSGEFYPDMYYDRSIDQGATWSGEVKLNDSPNLGTFFSAIAISGPAVHTIWGSRPSGASQDMGLFYRRNPTGNLIGVSSVSFGELSQSKDLHTDRSVRVEQVSSDAISIQWSQRDAGADDVSLAGIDRVDIYDINGHRVESLSVEPGSNAVMWSVGRVPHGLYLAQLMSDDVSGGRAFVIHVSFP